MSRTLLAACAGLTFWGLALSAQTPQAAMTVTGCLKPWTGSIAGAGSPANPQSGAPTPNDTADEAHYVLTDIATSPTQKPGESHAMYLLKPKDATINLGQHVNHKVQVAGAVSSESSPAPRDTSLAAAGKPATLTVSAITMVAATCTTTVR
jgi:hypothetical protein